MAIPSMQPSELAAQVCKALGLDLYEVARLVIDIPTSAGTFPMVYVEMVGSDALLAVEWDLLSGAKVTASEKVK